MAQEVKGLHTKLKLEGTAIANVVSISGPSLEVGTVEISNLEDSKRRYLATIADAGELSAEVIFIPFEAGSPISGTDVHSDLFDLWDNSDPVAANWTLAFNDETNSEWDFSGILTGLEISGMEIDGVVQASVSIKLSGGINEA